MSAKILSVDDSRTIRLIVGKAFKPYECTVFEAGNGEEGLAAAAREKPDLIVLDVTMPIMDGVTMLTKLKEDETLKGFPSSCSPPSPGAKMFCTSPSSACATTS